MRGGNRKILTDWSRDGFLLYTEIDPKTGADLWYLRLDGGAEGNAKPVPFLQTEFDESLGQISPDGRWLAYVSNDSGDLRFTSDLFHPALEDGGYRRVRGGTLEAQRRSRAGAATPRNCSTSPVRWVSSH